jgi:hypothetical protein
VNKDVVGVAAANADLGNTEEEPKKPLRALFVDDDAEIIQQCRDLLPAQVGGEPIEWEYVDSFEAAAELLNRTRFDVLVTDVYKGRRISNHLGIGEADNHARFLVDVVKKSGFSLVVLYSDGPRPDGMLSSPSIQFVDKAAPRPPFPQSVVEVLAQLLTTRGKSLEILNRIRMELEQSAGSYIWGFIDQNWETLKTDPAFEQTGLERLIRRRAVIQINEVLKENGLEERTNADKYDYYVCPPLPGDLRLGTVLKEKASGNYFVLLTPNCHLASQLKGGERLAPRADMVLLAACVDARATINAEKSVDKSGSLRIPARAGKPEGRFCFLPGFLSVPDLYCDLMQLHSLPIADALGEKYERIMVIDSPFAEAIQASLARFYANVGNRNLQESEFSPLFQKPAAPPV